MLMDFKILKTIYILSEILKQLFKFVNITIGELFKQIFVILKLLIKFH